MKIHIVSGFLGAGKTTFIKKMLPLFMGKAALIENEFGNVSIDGDLFDSQLNIKEIYAGCICCSLVGSFREAIQEMYEKYNPDHLIIEPSGVGSLSDILKVCQETSQRVGGGMTLGSVITLVDATSYRDYKENFGVFYSNQIQNAQLILMSHQEALASDTLDQIVEDLQTLSSEAYIFKAPWCRLDTDSVESLFQLGASQKEGPPTQLVPKANQVLKSYGIKDIKPVDIVTFEENLKKLPQFTTGQLVRAKGILQTKDGRFLHFDRTANHWSWSYIDRVQETKVVMIGSDLDLERLYSVWHPTELV